MTYMAYMIPGMKPKIVNRQQISKEVPHPVSMKTPKGGNITAPMNLKISEKVKAISRI